MVDLSEDLKSFSYHSPTKLVVGPGSLKKLVQLVSSFGGRALLVSDKVVSATIDLNCTIRDPLEQAGVRTSVFDDILPNPRRETVAQGAESAKEHGADFIVAVGGGSVLDSAKSIAVVARYGGDIWDYIGDNLVPGPVCPIVTIPTTSGTGSETTPFAVLTREEGSRKDGFASPYIFPTVSILDPLVTRRMPAGLTADTGLDALAHAVEAYTGCSANPMSDGLAETTMALIAKYLVRAVRNGEDLEARQGMAVASALAGMCITQAGVGAAHGFGMSMGGLFDLPHGRTIGVLLPLVMAYNKAVLPERFARIAEILRNNAGGEWLEGAADAASTVSILNREIGLPARLGSLGVSPAQLNLILDDCLARGDFRNNPRAFSREEAFGFLQAAV